jgi:hypothetical protein
MMTEGGLAAYFGAPISKDSSNLTISEGQFGEVSIMNIPREEFSVRGGARIQVASRKN